jgi:hypothetical protein
MAMMVSCGIPDSSGGAAKREESTNPNIKLFDGTEDNLLGAEGNSFIFPPSGLGQLLTKPVVLSRLS